MNKINQLFLLFRSSTRSTSCFFCSDHEQDQLAVSCVQNFRSWTKSTSCFLCSDHQQDSTSVCFVQIINKINQLSYKMFNDLPRGDQKCKEKGLLSSHQLNINFFSSLKCLFCAQLNKMLLLFQTKRQQMNFNAGGGPPELTLLCSLCGNWRAEPY